MNRRLLGKLVHAQPCGSLPHPSREFGVVHHHKLPRLGVAGRRSQAGRLKDALQLFALHRPVLVSAITLAAGRQLQKIHCYLSIYKFMTIC